MADPRGRGVADKSAVTRGQLRGKFAVRDRLISDLAMIDSDISQLVRVLSTQQGLITPMRVEQARLVAFQVLGAKNKKKEDAA